MFENIISFFKKLITKDDNEQKIKDQAKERLHLVLMQDRSNVSYEFLDLMKQEIIEVIKKYIEVDDELIDVRLTNELQEDKKTTCPTLYANIPISKIKDYTARTQKNEEKIKVDDKILKTNSNKTISNKSKNEKSTTKPKTKSKATININTSKNTQIVKKSNSNKTISNKTKVINEKPELKATSASKPKPKININIKSNTNLNPNLNPNKKTKKNQNRNKQINKNKKEE